MNRLHFNVPNKVVYKNWKGETRVRTIIPKQVVYESNEYHPELQWMLIATDVEKNEDRTFALKDMIPWKP